MEIKNKTCPSCCFVWIGAHNLTHAVCPHCKYPVGMAAKITELDAENERLRKMLERCWDALDCVKAGERVSSETAHFYWNIRDDVRRTLDAALTEPT